MDDLADACLYSMREFESENHINVGTGEDQTIRELAELVREIVAPEVALVFDPSKPDGSPRKLLDMSRLHNLGWHHRIELRDGISEAYLWFVQHYDEILASRGPESMARPTAGAALA